MIDIPAIFKNKVPDREKLLQYGFSPVDDDAYTKDFPILDDRFIASVTVTADGGADFRVYDVEDDEEYLPAHIYNATGSFVGTIHKACEDILNDVCRKCCQEAVFRGAQSKRILRFIKDTYDAQPEFLWSSLPECAAVRVPDKKSWFAVVGRVPKSKFVPKESGVAEVINLKDEPDSVKAYLAEGTAYPAYHMNKQHWYTLFLNEQIPDVEIMKRIEKSYALIHE